MESALPKLFEYGISGIVIAILFFIVWKLLVWVMAFIKTLTEQHNEERKIWVAVIESLKASIEIHNQQSVEARRQQAEAHNFQRLEHQEMIKTLGRINGYTDKQ